MLAIPLSSGGSAAAAAGANDSCGYASSTFTESTVMRWAQVNGQGSGAQIVGFANDEKGLLMGVNGATPVSAGTPNGTNSVHASNVSGGDPALKDPSNRPFYPALYVSDITGNPAATTGQFDFQNGGSPVNLKGGKPFIDDAFGAWSTATITNGNYQVTPPPQQNHWTLGTGSDQPVGTTFAAMGDEGYGTEVRWNASELTDGAGNALAPGHTYRVQVLTHDGDQNKSGGDAGEFCVTLKIPGPPPLSTQSSPSPSGTVGDTITDKATLTGNPTPTGSVTFRLYNDASCTNLLFSDTESLSGGVATSAGYKSTSPGTYYWVDTYSGDSNWSAAGPFPGAPGSSACSTDAAEQTLIKPLTTSMTTSATRSVLLGGSITDVATLPGAAGKPTPTGSVTFKAYSDSSCTNLVYTDTETLSGGQATAGGFAPSHAGTYYWVDTYSGDSSYAAAGPFPGAPGSSACSSDPTEQSVVNRPPPPSMSTNATHAVTLGGSITDRALLTPAAGDPVPTGTVTFRLYSNATCTSLVYSDTEALNQNGQTTAVSFTPSSAGTYYWVDTYNGDANYPASGPFPGAPGSRACSSDPTEQSTVSTPPQPGINVVKLDSVPCADLAGQVAQPPDVTCVNGHTTFTRGIITVSVPKSGSYSIPISYQIRVSNTGQTPLVLSIDDPMCDAGTIVGPSPVSGTVTQTPSGPSLSAGGSAVYTCTHTLTQNDPSAGGPGDPFTNTVTVTGTPPSGPPVHGTSIVTVDRHNPPVSPFCIARRGKHVGHKINWPKGTPKPKACRPPRPPHPRHPRRPSGFTG
jgi:hypothetical protein